MTFEFSSQDYQPSLFDVPKGEPSPADKWSEDSSKRALDELFCLTTQYRSTEQYLNLLKFSTRFRRYSPFNCMLMHIQKPGTVYAAPPNRWLRDYGRRIMPNAQPIVILQPMGPVMFIFDISDTEGDDLPAEIEKPLEITNGKIGSELERLIHNSKRDGVRVSIARHGSHRGGSMGKAKNKGIILQFGDKEQIPLRYELLLSEHLSREARFATLVHELAHLYCGHIGTPEPKWWPDRRGLGTEIIEFEAESVAYLVCKRKDINPASDKYLSSYLENGQTVPSISLERVMTVAGLIETMTGTRKMKPRKQPSQN